MSAAPSPKNDDPRDEATPVATALPPGGTWSGRFAEPMSARMERFNASIDFDQRLADVDIAASLAHARMLAHTNIISADDLRAMAARVPLDRLLVETDCPYLAPVPVRGQRNEPAFVAHTAALLAQVRGVPADELAEQTTRNALALFAPRA